MALKVTGFVEYALLTVDWLWMVVDGYMEYRSRHDHETFFLLPLLAWKVSSGCFKVSQG